MHNLLPVGSCGLIQQPTKGLLFGGSGSGNTSSKATPSSCRVALESHAPKKVANSTIAKHATCLTHRHGSKDLYFSSLFTESGIWQE